MDVKLSHDRPSSEACLSSDELFETFMDIAVTYEQDYVPGDASLIENSNGCSNGGGQEDPKDEEIPQTENRSHVNADDIDCSLNEEKQQIETVKECHELANGNSEIVHVNNDTRFSNEVDTTVKASVTEEIRAVQDEIPERTKEEDLVTPVDVEVSLSTEFTDGDSNLATQKLDSEVRDYAQPLPDLKVVVQEEQTNEQTNEQSVKDDMDITLNGVTFSWDPSKPVEQKTSDECSCDDVEKSHTGSEEASADLDCNSCNKLQGESSNSVKELNKGEDNDVTDGNLAPDRVSNSGGVIKEMYYDSPRESITYDSVNIQKCIDIIDERYQTSSLEKHESSLQREDKNSKFYLDIRLDQNVESSLPHEKGNIVGQSSQNGGTPVSGMPSDKKSASLKSKNSSTQESYSDEESPEEENFKNASMTSTASEQEFVSQYNADFPRKESATKNPVIHSGMLNKLGGSGIKPKNWRKRWFELKVDNCLYYYKNPKDKKPVGTIILANYLVTRCVDSGRKSSFKLTKGGAKTYCLATESDEEMKHWMKVLSEASKSSWDNMAHIPECSVKNVSIPALSIKDPDCHGYIWKQGNTHKSWKRRYCVLKSGCLYYYEDMSEPVAIGMFKLHNYDIQETEITGKKFSIIGVPPDPRMRTFYFSAENELDFNRWYTALQSSIQNIRKTSISSKSP